MSRPGLKTHSAVSGDRGQEYRGRDMDKEFVVPKEIDPNSSERSDWLTGVAGFPVAAAPAAPFHVVFHVARSRRLFLKLICYQR